MLDRRCLFLANFLYQSRIIQLSWSCDICVVPQRQQLAKWVVCILMKFSLHWWRVVMIWICSVTEWAMLGFYHHTAKKCKKYQLQFESSLLWRWPQHMWIQDANPFRTSDEAHSKSTWNLPKCPQIVIIMITLCNCCFNVSIISCLNAWCLLTSWFVLT